MAGTVSAQDGSVETVEIGATSYRIVSVQLVRQPTVFLAAVTPTSTIVAEQQSERTAGRWTARARCC